MIGLAIILASQIFFVNVVKETKKPKIEGIYDTYRMKPSNPVTLFNCMCRFLFFYLSIPGLAYAFTKKPIFLFFCLILEYLATLGIVGFTINYEHFFIKEMLFMIFNLMVHGIYMGKVMEAGVSTVYHFFKDRHLNAEELVERFNNAMELSALVGRHVERQAWTQRDQNRLRMVNDQIIAGAFEMLPEPPSNYLPQYTVARLQEQPENNNVNR